MKADARISSPIGIAFVAVFFSMATAEDGPGHDIKLTKEDLLEGLKMGQQYLDDLNRLEAELVENEKNKILQGTPAYSYARFKPHSPEALVQAKEASVQLVARQHLSQKFGIPADRIKFDDEISPSNATDRQMVPVYCSYDSTTFRYRTINGQCNNMLQANYGKAITVFQRFLNVKPSYKEGETFQGVPRNGPSPRAISLGVLDNKEIADNSATLMTMQFGQFLDHDLTLTPTFALVAYGSSATFPINCCTGPITGTASSPLPHPECFPIEIPSNDPLFSPSTCMNFVRSLFFNNNIDGSISTIRQQINANTHWLDGSHIYGSMDSTAENIRDRSSGRGLLKTSVSPDGRVLLPTTTCPSCFEAGDSRVTEQPLLTIMHTLFVREHNRVANKLVSRFPGKDDEFYYQEARRIVIAKWQHIVYTEYLPVLLGPVLSAIANAPRTEIPGNPNIYNEFATAAFRMGHSQLKSFIRLLDINGKVTTDSYALSDSFQSGAKLLNPAFMDSALRGLVDTPVNGVDNGFVDDVTSQLFKPPGSKLGFDLVSLNIQRGRDHGLPPYAHIWQYINPKTLDCTKSNPILPIDFNDLKATTSPKIIKSLRDVYPSVLDVDLYIGGVTEDPVPGGLVGPTFGTIIAHQFKNLKQADRFFYDDLSQSVSAFTSAELMDIKKVSIARIICDNSDGTIAEIQPKAFLLPNKKGNKPVPCNQIPASTLF